ncbi:MAG: ATP synthase subunit I [Acidimicrobiales bacterium]
MDRLAAVLGQLDLPELSRMLRRTVFAALGVGLVALVVLSLVGYPLAGLGSCIGLGLGIVNIRLVMSTASRLNASGATKIKRPMATNTLTRLALTTVIAIGLVVVDLALGMGVLGGIAVFYLLFVVSLVVTLLRQGVVT